MASEDKKVGIEPLGTRVIVRKDEPIEETENGLILTGTSRKTPIWGMVAAVGPGTEDEPMTLKIGDKVIFPTSGGMDIEVDDIEYTIFKLEDILAVARILDEDEEKKEEGEKE